MVESYFTVRFLCDCSCHAGEPPMGEAMHRLSHRAWSTLKREGWTVVPRNKIRYVLCPECSTHRNGRRVFESTTREQEHIIRVTKETHD